MSATYNLVVPQATTFNFQFVIKTDNIPWDLTNYSATLTVRPFLGSTTTTLLATNTNGKILLGGSTGRITVTFTATETNINPESYVYDLVVNSGGTITRLLEGQFLVVGGVTV